MAYEHDVSVPLPPLREIGSGASASPVESVAPTSADARELALELEPSSTRKGGTELHPKLNPLREVHVDRAPDVRALPDDSDVVVGAGESSRGEPLVLPVAVWFVIGIVVIWICCQLAPLVIFALGCRGWRLVAALGALSIPVAIFGFVAFRVWRLFGGLPSFEQVRMSRERSYEVKHRLSTGYLARLPDAETYAREAGFEGDRRRQVVDILDRLRGGKRYSDEVGWLDDFGEFERLQSERASAIIRRSCKLIGLKTAASPWKLVDVICVFWNSTQMVVQLARLYNRRVNRGAAFRLVFRWFLNIYVSGELGQLGESVSGAIGDNLKEPVRESLSDIGWLDGDWSETVASAMPTISKFVGKVAEGGLNAFLAYRMGCKAVVGFKPVVTD